MTVKPRFYVFVAVIFILIIITVIAASSSSGVRKKPAGIYTCTVNAEVGLSLIKITNQNTGTSIEKTASDLPYRFNFTAADTLSFNLTQLPDYRFSGWEINMKPWFAQNNPLLCSQVESDFSLTATFIPKTT